jgi:putative nucleotidyltransferase with HDIG domain
MGLGAVLSVAIAASMRDRFYKPIPAYGLAEGALWRHSVATAVGAECLAAVCRIRVPPPAFTAALLHDIGKLVLCRFLDDDLLADLERTVDRSGCTLPQAEMRLLGVDHAELGGMVARHWKLPPSIVHGITHHHDPDRGEATICDIVHVADTVANLALTEEQWEEIADGNHWSAVQPSVLERIEIGPQDLDEIAHCTASRLAEVMAQYSA